MTIQQKLEQSLVDNGMWPQQANTVIEAMKEEDRAMEGRWSEDENAYPPMMITVLFLTAKNKALLWAKENCPDAYFIPLLEM